MPYAGKFARSTVDVTTRPIALPHPEEELRDCYNRDLNTLILAIGVESHGGADPRHCFWPERDSIASFRRGLDKEGLFKWLSGTFNLNKRDRGVLSESPILELLLRFEDTVKRIFQASSCGTKTATIRLQVEIKGPTEAVERIEKAVGNAALWALLSNLQNETLSLGGEMVLTYRAGRPWIGIRENLGIRAFFSVPYVPTGPNGEELDLPYEHEQERHL
jgi:hypothetical protein